MQLAARGVAAEYLADWRRFRALTQNELADRAHVSRPTIARAEAGAGIDAAKLRAIAEALHISVAQLHEPPPAPPTPHHTEGHDTP